MDNKLRELQMCELEILKEFVRICDRFSLRYYLTGGTLLGAVRHQGFIPWDDDIDVTMPREDYDRFAHVCASALDKKFFYQSPETDANYYLSYAKLRKKNTEVYEPRFQLSKFYKGVFIDIFPLDFCPKPGLACHLLFNILAVMNYRGQIDSGEKYAPYQELSGKIGYTILRLFSRNQIVKLRKYLLRISEKLSGKRHVVIYAGAYGYYREVMPREWYFGNNKIRFEGQDFSAPKNPQGILAQVYGERYMELPEQSEQRGHIELNKSYL